MGRGDARQKKRLVDVPPHFFLFLRPLAACTFPGAHRLRRLPRSSVDLLRELSSALQREGVTSCFAATFPVFSSEELLCLSSRSL